MAIIVSSVGALIEYVGIIIVIVAVILALFHLLSKKKDREGVRQELARNVMFGLEFIIAADILLVAVANDLTDVLQLGGVVVIRILLGYALRKGDIK